MIAAHSLVGKALSGMQTNTMMASMVGLWGVAVLTFVTKDIPNRVWKLIRRQITTSIEVTSMEPEFTALTRWLETKQISKSARTLRVRREIVTIGFGNHFFRHKGRLCSMYRGQVEAKSSRLIEEITISYFGRSQKFLRSLIADAVEETEDKDNTTKIYCPQYSGWTEVTQQPKRRMNSVLLAPSAREKLITHLDWFHESRKWHQSLGIPYRTGVCLYGPPGTGKTSLVRAIAAQYDLDIYSVDLNDMKDADLKSLIWQAGRRALILIEDIDTLQASRSRDDNSDKDESSSKVTLGGLLNAIDGIVDSDGRIFVMTTNHLEKVDPALLRPGRINISLELGYMNSEMFVDGFKRFFPSFEPCRTVRWKQDITPAQFQGMVLRNSSEPLAVLDEVIEGRSLTMIRDVQINS